MHAIFLGSIFGTTLYVSLYGYQYKIEQFKVVGDPCQKITLLLLKSKSVRVIVPESCF